MVLAGVALAASLSAAVLATADEAKPAAPVTAVGVGAREFSLSPYRTSVPRGVVRFNLSNYGEDGHDLVVQSRAGRELARSAEVRAGQRTTVSVRLAAGRYTLVCDLADHAARGMRTSILVKRAGR
jgi:plastocyanin